MGNKIINPIFINGLHICFNMFETIFNEKHVAKDHSKENLMQNKLTEQKNGLKC